MVKVFLLSLAQVRELKNEVVYVHFLLLGIQDFSGMAVWVVPVSAKNLFFLLVYFKGPSHGEVVIIVQMLWILQR